MTVSGTLALATARLCVLSGTILLLEHAAEAHLLLRLLTSLHKEVVVLVHLRLRILTAGTSRCAQRQ